MQRESRVIAARIAVVFLRLCIVARLVIEKIPDTSRTWTFFTSISLSAIDSDCFLSYFRPRSRRYRSEALLSTYSCGGICATGKQPPVILLS